MNQHERERWKSQVLDEIFIALAASSKISGVLVFKGARVLNARMKDNGRQSLDLDSNLLKEFVTRVPDRGEQRNFLEQEISQAVRRHFEQQNPVTYHLTNIKVQFHPPKDPHPLGWDAFVVKMNVDDLGKSVRGLPVLEIDIAAPEDLLETSVRCLEIGGHQANAYTLERIAGEKLRAFLSSLPAYRAKVAKPGEAVRVKDLYDICRIYRAKSMQHEKFWRLAGQEFRLACRSRFIDCQGLVTFQEGWTVTQKTYEEATIPSDILFNEIEITLKTIIDVWESQGILPFQFPLPVATPR